MNPDLISAVRSRVLHQLGMCIVDFDNGSWCRQHDQEWHRDRGDTVCEVIRSAYELAESVVEAVEPMIGDEIVLRGDAQVNEPMAGVWRVVRRRFDRVGEDHQRIDIIMEKIG